jgi:hypothetical protein
MSGATANPFGTLFVAGHGFFSSHHGSAADALRDARIVAPRKPQFELLVARARRFTSLVTQTHVEVCGQALRVHAATNGEAPFGVFASQHGELQIAADLISDLLTLKSVSSARFALSVHNAPSGLLSIATKNTRATTTIAAGELSWSAGLLEAYLTAREREAPVLLSYADEPVPALFGGPLTDFALGFALLLSPAPGPNDLGTLELSDAPGVGAASTALLPAILTVAAAVESGREAVLTLASPRPDHVMGLVFSPKSG